MLSAYKQIRAQSSAVLADVNEGDFARAFAAIRPVIQGAADMGTRLGPDELEGALDFCGKLFAPTNPEMHVKLGKEMSQEWLDVQSPVTTPEEIQHAITSRAGEGDGDEVMMVLEKVNARRVVHKEHGGTSNFEDEPMEVNGEGWVVRLERGQFGLVRMQMPHQ